MQKKISVIVAVYNIASYLPRCLDSLLAQTCDDLEIILVDDGSTDQSGAICDQYAEKEAFGGRFQVIHKPNGGLSDARNAGLAQATGDYIGFVDGDDWVEPDMYRAMYTACEERQAQIAICRYTQIGEKAKNQPGTGKTVPLTREETLDIYICGHPQYVIYNSVWSKLFAREVLQNITFQVGKKSEDIMFTAQAFCAAERCVYLDTSYYNYVLDREGSIMNESLGERRFCHEIPLWKEQTAYFEAQGFIEQAEKSRYYFFRRMLFYYIEFKDRRSRKYAKQMIRLLRRERTVIRKSYHHAYVALGDRVRMSAALTVPDLYYLLVKLYDKYVIPLRQKNPEGGGV